MSTQEVNSNITNLMSDLGISSTESTPAMEEEVNNTTDELIANNSNDSTNIVDESLGETETETVNNTDTDTNSKRLRDKDRHINEQRREIDTLKKQVEELISKSNNQKVTEEVSQDNSTNFWDDPEGNFAKIREEVKITNLRLDENAYASSRPDYWDTVNEKSILDAFKEDATFENQFRSSAKPYEIAYEYLKSKNETKQQTIARQKEELETEIRNKILAEYGLDKKAKEVPPSIANVGSSNSKSSSQVADGFTAVFGNGY